MREKRGDVMFVKQRLPLSLWRDNTAHKLAGLLGITDAEFALAFEPVNILSGFPSKKAGRNARALMPKLKGRTAVLIGRRVAMAFGFPDEPFLSEVYVCHRLREDQHCIVRYVIIPHLHGKSGWWEKKELKQEVGSFLRRVLGMEVE